MKARALHRHLADEKGRRPSVLRGALALALCSVSILPSPALGATLSDDELAQVRFDQKLNAQVPLALPFQDATGREVRLGQYFGHRPVVLVLGYYQCPMLCTLVLNGVLESSADMKWSIGREFEMIDVSIDPRETPSLAAAKKRTYVKRYGRANTEAGWHFLTGTETAIRQLTSQVGFHYAYDPESKQYAHPSGLIILTPEGRVSGYLFGVTYPSKDLYESLVRASSRLTSSPIQQFILLCFHYNPITGKYGGLIIVLLRCLSGMTLLGLLCLILLLARRRQMGPAQVDVLQPNELNSATRDATNAKVATRLPDRASVP